MAELSNSTFRILAKVIHNVPAAPGKETYYRPLVRDARLDACVNRLVAEKMKLQGCVLSSSPHCTDVEDKLASINYFMSKLYDSKFYTDILEKMDVKGINVEPPILELLPIAIYT
jgi:hypothetical protein